MTSRRKKGVKNQVELNFIRFTSRGLVGLCMLYTYNIRRALHVQCMPSMYPSCTLTYKVRRTRPFSVMVFNVHVRLARLGGPGLMSDLSCQSCTTYAIFNSASLHGILKDDINDVHFVPFSLKMHFLYFI